MILSFSKRFVFVHIHRTGGSSLERAIEPHLNWRDIILGSSDFGEAVAPAFAHRFGLHKHSSIRDIERICGEKYIDSYWCTALVRHPIKRICSLYNFTASLVLEWADQRGISRSQLMQLVTASDVASYAPLSWPTSQAFIRSESFGDYIRSCALAQEDGFKTQASRLCSGRNGALCAEPLRLEDQASWLPFLSTRLGIEIDLSHYHKSDLQMVRASSLRTEDVLYLEEIFEQDFRLFGY